MFKFIKGLFSMLIAGREEKFYINVPYAEKDIVKKLGAKWDSQKKSWFIPEKIALIKFEKWIEPNLFECIDSNIRSLGFFVAESLSSCWNCKRITQVFSFLLPEDHQVKDFDEERNEIIWETFDYQTIVSYVSFINKKAVESIQKISNHYYIDFSKQTGESYYMNHCKNCSSKLGDYYMHSEPGGAFQPMTSKIAKNMKLYWCDDVFEAEVGSYSIEVDYFEYMKQIYRTPSF
jgi:hypothetical protein